MIAGSLGRLQNTVDEPLESWYRGGGSLPALDVKTTQDSFDDRPIQSGLVAATTTRRPQVPTVTVDASGDPAAIITEEEEVGERLLSKFVADVTGTGLVVAESTDGDGDLDFPFDMFYERTGERVERLNIDVAEMHTAWSKDDAIGDVWMNGADAGDGASIDYHSRADADATPTIGLGFTRPWSGTVMDGVVYESGYIAVYNTNVAEEFIRFVEDELLEFAYVPGEDEGEAQSTLGSVSDDASDDFADEVADELDGQGVDYERDVEAGGDPEEGECRRCEREPESGLTDSGYCIVCDDKLAEEEEEARYERLETVTMSDGGEDDVE